MANVLKLGIRLDLIKAGKKIDSPDAPENKYASTILDIDEDEDNIIISNPTLKARLILMHKNERFDAYFYANNKIYIARVTVVKNITERNMRSVMIHLDTAVDKFERRQFFRLEVNMDVRYLMLTPQNTAAFKTAIKNNNLLSMEGFQKGTTCDLSGGGVRFTTMSEMPIDSMLIMHIVSTIEGKIKNYVFVGKILDAQKHERVRGMFQYRVQFVDLKQEAREELVQYIFQKERESLRKIR